MRWISKPEWGPILVVALAGALAVPFIPFVNLTAKSLLLFLPTSMFYFTGVAMSAVLALATWRLMMAGFIIADEKGIVLVKVEKNELLPWNELDIVGFEGPGKDAKGRFTFVSGEQRSYAFLRTPRNEFMRLRTKIADPILMLPPEERASAAKQVIEENARDDLILIILRVYAGLLGFMGVMLACLL
ncbi:MAG: hypothetical protein EP330_03710 [Deltaproteobacteria bacterium]|nr:MAG: hypothetical protein EP330_03710 [Deltaproteobacteria bacterium]